MDEPHVSPQASLSPEIGSVSISAQLPAVATLPAEGSSKYRACCSPRPGALLFYGGGSHLLLRHFNEVSWPWGLPTVRFSEGAPEWGDKRRANPKRCCLYALTDLLLVIIIIDLIDSLNNSLPLGPSLREHNPFRELSSSLIDELPAVWRNAPSPSPQRAIYKQYKNSNNWYFSMKSLLFALIVLL